MPTARVFPCFGLDGLPNAAAVPTFTAYVDKAGVARTPPAIENLGGGQFAFTPSVEDENVGSIALIDFGADCEPRYGYEAIHALTNTFALFVPFDAGGVPSTGAPTVGSYVSFAGAARTPPAVVQAGALEFYTLTPTTEDQQVGVGYRLDSSGGALPPFITGTFYSAANLTFRELVVTIAPELANPAISDMLWEIYIEWAFQEISSKAFGNRTGRINQLAANLVAHMLTLWLMRKNSGGDAAASVGAPTMIRVGNVSTSYAQTGGDSSSFIGALGKTGYGQEYARLVRRYLGISTQVAGGFGPVRGWPGIPIG